ncbi:MAG: hypothetical protein C4293_00115 [Nitrospiraceae bacterium]
MTPLWIAAGGLTALIVFWIGKTWLGRSSDLTGHQKSLIPSGISLVALPLLSKDEASFYNVLRLTVQDEYLVFGQIPLWCLIDIKSLSRRAKTAFLAKIALKRVDFVLVHPGTLTVAKVIELESKTDDSPHRQARNRLIEETLKRAGIELVRVPMQSYTMPELAAILDIEPME